MTQAELQALLDKPFTVAVEINANTFPNNVPYAQISNLAQTGFTFTPRELLHAIGSKTATLPSSKLDECFNAAYLYSHILDFTGSHLGYKPDLHMDADLQTNRSNEIGIGMGCLLANKQFNVPWDTLESITGPGKRFDYRATNSGQNYAYEFKGTKHIRTQTTQVRNGIAKKTAMHQRAEQFDVELIISTYLGLSNTQPRIVLADPPFTGFKDAFTDEAQELYSLRHLTRLAQFIGDTFLARALYTEAQQLFRQISQRLSDEKAISIITKTLIAAEAIQQLILFPELKRVTLNIDNIDYVGRWVSYWRPDKKAKRSRSFQMPPIANNQKLEIFQGIRSDLYEWMGQEKTESFSPLVGLQSRTTVRYNIEFMTFTDGSIMGYRLV